MKLEKIKTTYVNTLRFGIVSGVVIKGFVGYQAWKTSKYLYIREYRDSSGNNIGLYATQDSKKFYI